MCSETQPVFRDIVVQFIMETIFPFIAIGIAQSALLNLLFMTAVI